MTESENTEPEANSSKPTDSTTDTVQQVPDIAQRMEARFKAEPQSNGPKIITACVVLFLLVGGGCLYVFFLHNWVMSLFVPAAPEPKTERVTSLPQRMEISLKALDQSLPELEGRFSGIPRAEVAQSDQRTFKIERPDNAGQMIESEQTVSKMRNEEVFAVLKNNLILFQRHSAIFTEMEIPKTHHQELHEKIIQVILAWRIVAVKYEQALMQLVRFDVYKNYAEAHEDAFVIAELIFRADQNMSKRIAEGFTVENLSTETTAELSLNALCEKLNDYYAFNTLQAILGTRRELYSALSSHPRLTYKYGLHEIRYEPDYVTPYEKIESAANLYRKRFPIIGELLLVPRMR